MTFVAAYLAVVVAAGPPSVAWRSLRAWPPSAPSEQALNADSHRELSALGRAVLAAGRTAKDANERRWLELENREVQAALASAALGRGRGDAGAADPADPARDAFWQTWVAEQLRLARLFSKTTSEVFRLEASDVTGDELADWQFVLTFDDGPTPAKDPGTTDTTAALHQQHWPATFFVQGERVRARADAAKVYDGFCVASHGERHVPHTDLEVAKKSVAATVAALFPLTQARADLFRPPYGQRSPAVARWLGEQRLRTVLWNIDSQDWRSAADADLVAGRVWALMLVRRRGVILFHDVHPLARQVLPLLAQRLEGTGIRFVSCDEAWPK